MLFLSNRIEEKRLGFTVKDGDFVIPEIMNWKNAMGPRWSDYEALILDLDAEANFSGYRKMQNDVAKLLRSGGLVFRLIGRRSMIESELFWMNSTRKLKPTTIG